jgi:hypothetical protein
MGKHSLAVLWVHLLLGSCSPSAFDDLKQSAGADAAGQPDGALDEELDGGSVDADQELDAELLEPDAQEALDAVDGETGDAAAAEACRSAARPLSVSRPATVLASLAESAAFVGRALGPTIRFGETDHVWTFASALRASSASAPAATPANHPYLAFDGRTQPWKRDLAGALWTLREPSSGSTLPPTLLPLRGGEAPSTRLVPRSFVRMQGETRGTLFVVQYDSGAASKVWLATVDDGGVIAVRAEQPLFSAPRLFAYGARADGTDLNLYGCSPASAGVPSRCVAARVPSAQIDQPSAYQVRALNADGQPFWSDDLDAGLPLLENVNDDLTITYNAYLSRFLAVYGEPGSSDAVLRTAPQPYGPWSEPVRVPLPAPPVLHNDHIHEHPSLAQDCERRLVISYFAPSAAVGSVPTAGDAVLVAIDLD